MTDQLRLSAKASIGGTAIALDAISAGGSRRLTVSLSGVTMRQVWERFRQWAGPSLALPDLPSAGVFDDLIAGPLTISATIASGAQGGMAAALDLAYTPAVGIPDAGSTLGRLFGQFATVEGLLIGYDQDAGFDVRLRIATSFPSNPPPGAPPGPASVTKRQVVSYPPPLPAQNGASAALRLNYLGIGQRVGPDPVTDPNVDPLATIFSGLASTLATADPAAMLRVLARDFYKPDRDWFVAADVMLHDFQVQGLFNDPAMYGLRIAVSSLTPPPFGGLLFEILYQKLGPGLGVYYGALTLPTQIRQIDIDGLILVLPGFQIWVYTDGDFRLNVGWPLGPNSISAILGPLVGRAGFYFARLRTADQPGAVTAGADFNPILQFGIAFDLYVSVDCSAGPLSASLSVSFQAAMQGVLAWKEGDKVVTTPDHYWFAGSALLNIVVQGAIDFTIIKASLTISLTAEVMVAFETGCTSVVAVSAEVSVEVSVHVLFCTIHCSFDMEVSHSFSFGSGPDALVSGPVQPGLAFTPATPPATPAGSGATSAATLPASPGQPTQQVAQQSATRLRQPAIAVSAARIALFRALLDDGPTQVTAQFALLPTALFDGSAPALATVAALLLDAPEPGAFATDRLTGFERLATAALRWLLGLFDGAPPALLQAAADALGHGGAAPPVDGAFKGLDGFVASSAAGLGASIRLSLVSASPGSAAGAMLPMPDGLTLTVGGGTGTAIGPDRYAAADLVALEDRLAGLGLPESGSAQAAAPQSLATLILTDWFLLLLRQMVGSLVLPGTSTGWRDEIAAGLAAMDMAGLAGFASRMLVSGQQVPPPGGGSPAPVFLCTGQQVAGATSASLGVPANHPWVAAGSTAASLPGTPTLHRPRYEWVGDVPSAAGQIGARSIPTLVPGPVSVVLGQPVPVTGGGAIAGLLALPARLMPGPRSKAGTGPQSTLALASVAGAGHERAGLAGAPCLAIPLAISRVRAPGTTLGWLPGLYAVQGTDDATRELLQALVDDPAASGECIVGVAVGTSAGGLAVGGDAAPMLVRTVPPAAAIDPGSAVTTDPAGFLRMLWEACVAPCGGTYLHVPALIGDAAAEDALFASGPSIDIRVLAARPTLAAPVPLPPWANAVTIGDLAAGTAVQATSADASGAPVLVPGLAPAGSSPVAIGFELDIMSGCATAPTGFDAAALYHMLQFSLGGGAWSAPLGPLGEASALWRYQQVLPAPSGGSNPYDAVGETVALQFRLLDIFGNILPDVFPGPGTPFALTPGYSDRLVGAAEWPGVQMTHGFSAAGATSAAVTLTLSFDPGGLGAGGLSGAQARYAAILAQLTDQRLSFAIATTLDGDGPALPLRDALVDFVTRILAALGAAGGPAGGPGPVQAVPLGRPVPFAPILAAAGDVLPLAVQLVLERPAALVDPALRATVPEVARVASPARPWLPPADAATAQRDLARFAQAFETAFAAMPHPGGGTTDLQLAQRAGTPTGDPAEVPELWAVRFGAGGFALSRPAGAIHTTYALRPLCNQLLNGTDSAGVLHSNVDLDATAAACLAAIDAALAPGRAAALAALGPADPATPDITWLDRLLAAKQTLAARIPAGLAKVLPDDPDGDPTAARAALQTALLGTLASASSVTAIVQNRLEVSVEGVAATATTLPVLAGDIGAAPQPGAAAPSTHFFFSSAGLSHDAATGNCHLTSLLSVAEPTGQTELALALTWTPGSLQHDVELAESYGGFTPSSWLRLVLPWETVDLGAAALPVPLWVEPDRPKLASHRATAANAADQGGGTGDDSLLPAEIASVLTWQYDVALSATLEAQDELVLDPGFNAAPTPPELGAVPALLLDFFRAAVDFATALPGAVPTLAALDAPLPTGDALTALAAGLGPIVVGAERLAATWRTSPPPVASAAETGLILAYDAAGACVTLRTPGATAPSAWPNLTLGAAPLAADPGGPVQQSGGWTLRYPLAARPDLGQLALRWGPIAFRDAISADFRCSVVRNPVLVAGRPTDAAFVFRTPVLGFPSPLVPLLSSAGLPAVPPTVPLATILATLLATLAAVKGVAQPVISLEATYQATRATGGATGLPLRYPVLMGSDLVLPTTPADITAMAAALVGEIVAWRARAKPATAGASLLFSTTLFGVPSLPEAQELPLIRLRRLVVLLDGAGPDFWQTPADAAPTRSA